MEEGIKQCFFYRGIGSQYCHLTSAKAMGSIGCTVRGGLDSEGKPLECLSQARENSKDVYVKIPPGTCSDEGFKRLGIEPLIIRGK